MFLNSEKSPALRSLNEIVTQLLNNASKQFQNCPILKIALGARNYEMRGDGIHNRPYGARHREPNPINIQIMQDMGFGYSRDQIV